VLKRACGHSELSPTWTSTFCCYLSEEVVRQKLHPISRSPPCCRISRSLLVNSGNVSSRATKHSSSDQQTIVDLRYTWSRPRCPLSLFALCPRTHLPSQNHLGAANIDVNLLHVHLGSAPHGIFNFSFHFGRSSYRCDFDVVGYALYAGQIANSILDRDLLMLV
jgi:hypothetical protein